MSRHEHLSATLEYGLHNDTCLLRLRGTVQTWNDTREIFTLRCSAIEPATVRNLQVNHATLPVLVIAFQDGTSCLREVGY